MADKVKTTSGGGLKMPAFGESGRLLQEALVKQAQEPPFPKRTPANITSNITENITAQEDANADNREETSEETRADAHSERRVSALSSEHMTDKPASNEAINAASREGGKADASAGVQERARLPESPPESPRIPASAKPAGKTRGNPSGPEAVRAAASLAMRTPAVPITLRMPEAQNDWLDELAHTHRKSRVKKQDLIAAAVALLMIEVEGGRSITDLLEELGTRR